MHIFENDTLANRIIEYMPMNISQEKHILAEELNRLSEKFPNIDQRRYLQDLIRSKSGVKFVSKLLKVAVSEDVNEDV